MPRTLKELAKEYRELAEKCLETPVQDHPICDVNTAIKCAQLLSVDIEAELRKLAKQFPGTCLACKHSTLAYRTPAICDLTARFCELGKSYQNCDSFEPFEDL